MKKLFLCFPAILFLAVSCEKEEFLPARAGMISETVSGSRSAATKATISEADASFAWTEGDDVAVHISNGKYVYTSDEGASAAHITDVIHADNASFTVAYEGGYSRDAFAVFPSTLVAKDAANYGQEGHALDVTLPAAYTLAQVSGETSPCPMIATNKVGEGWDFYQLCSLLRLTVNSIPATAKRLEIDFNGKKVWGDFSIASPVVPGTSAIETAADDAHDAITITKDGTDAVLGQTSLMVNIPLPAGDYAEMTVRAYDALTEGNVILSVTRPFDRTSTNLRAFKRTASFPSYTMAFRGYEVSAGILERSVSGTDVTYSLTAGEMIMTYDPTTGKEVYALPAGCNPFEPAVHFKQSSSLNKYFHKWLTLRGELGADVNNISATSAYLPAGWCFPSGGDKSTSDWGKIIFGAPKSTITVNGTAVTSKAFALVSVTLDAGNSYGVAAGTYYGMFLLRDGSTIPSGYLNTTGTALYTANPLTEVQFNDLIKLGCLFISASGYYSELKNYGWRELNASWQYGCYWTSNYYSASQFYAFQFYNGTYSNNPSVNNRSTTSDKNYYVVKLVKPVNP